MKKMKYIVFFIILSSILMLLNIRTYAIENEDVINAIPDVIEINDSKEESIEEKLNEIQIPNEYEIKILSTNNYWSVNIGLKLKNKDEYIIQKAIQVNHTCDLIEEILKIIPSNVNIDVPEIEYDDEKSNKLVENEIEEVLRENKILMEDLEKNNIEISTFIHPLYSGTFPSKYLFTIPIVLFNKFPKSLHKSKLNLSTKSSGVNIPSCPFINVFNK